MPRRVIDTPSLPLTETEVKIYQEVYYEHYKPLVEKASNHPDSFILIKKSLAPILEKFGWDYKIFEAYMMIDFVQRVLLDIPLMAQSENLNLPKLTLTDERMYKFDPALGVPRLKCSKRTSSPDPKNLH